MALVLRTLRLVALGLRGELRNSGLRLLGMVSALGTAVFAWNAGEAAGSTALVLALWLGRAYGVAAALWLAYAAIRDLDGKTGALFRSKPVDGAAWVFARWLTGLGTWLALLGAPFLGAALAQVPAAGVASLLSHGWAFGRAALLVAGMGTMSFALSRLLRSPLGGIITVFAWFCAMAGLTYVPAFLQPEYTQNRLLYVAAPLLLLILAGLFVERFRRGELRRPLAAAAALAGCTLLAAAGGASAFQRASRLGMYGDTLASGISSQHIQVGERMPGFWLPDGRGGTVRTADHAGRILLVYLFGTDDLEAARTLSALRQIAKEYGGRGVQPLGVCISMDHGDGRALAAAGGYNFPIGSDLYTARAAPPDSPVAAAFDIQQLPMLIVTDRRRRVRQRQLEPFYDVAALRQLVEERLAEEPE